MPLDVSRSRGGIRVEQTNDGEWAVRPVISEKQYRCPGCNQMIAPSVNHLVAWQRDSWRGEQAGLDDRRHWHTACWSRRR